MTPTAWTTVAELIGFLMAAYGLLRESFTDLAQKRPWGEGRWGEGTWGGGPTRFEVLILWVGTILRLLPSDHALTLTDRKRNAVFAICGVLIGATALAYDAWLGVCGQAT